MYFDIYILLPAGSEEHEVLQTRSIHVAILPSCQFHYNSTFKCIDIEIIWVVKTRNTSETVLRPDRGPMGLSQYDGLGEYCGPHTASSVFLILIYQITYRWFIYICDIIVVLNIGGYLFLHVVSSTVYLKYRQYVSDRK